MGDQLHISVSARVSGRREGLSLGVGRRKGGEWWEGGAVLPSVVVPPIMPSIRVSPWSCVHPRQSPVPWTVLRHCRLPRDQGGAVCRPALSELCQLLAVKGLAERWLMNEVLVVAFMLSC